MNKDSNTQRYNEEFKFLLTEEQKEKLFFQAEIAGISSSEFLRRKISNHNISSKIEMTLINELRRQGGLVKNNFNTIKESTLDSHEKEEILILMKQTFTDMQNLINKVVSVYRDKQ